MTEAFFCQFSEFPLEYGLRLSVVILIGLFRPGTLGHQRRWFFHRWMMPIWHDEHSLWLLMIAVQIEIQLFWFQVTRQILAMRISGDLRRIGSLQLIFNISIWLRFQRTIERVGRREHERFRAVVQTSFACRKSSFVPSYTHSSVFQLLSDQLLPE